MERSAIRAIIFDLGNVVVNFDHRIAARRIAPHTDKNAEEIYRLFFDSEVTGIFEAGGVSPGEFFRAVKGMLNLAIPYEEFLPIWNEIFFLTDENRSVLEVARRLKARYPVALLSNINELHLEYLERAFPVFDAFTHVVASCRMRMIKPHPLLYQKTLELLGADPASTFYTDDRADLVDGARGLGIQGFVFRDAGQLKEDLMSVGINLS